MGAGVVGVNGGYGVREGGLCGGEGEVQWRVLVRVCCGSGVRLKG